MDNVFGILELAEMIFLECRIQDLLTNCQRVRKSWRDIIASSNRLQQALFFEPLPGYEIDHDSEDPDDGTNGRFIDYDIVGWQYDELSADAKRRVDDNERVLVFANPFLDMIRGYKRLTFHSPADYASNALKDYEERRQEFNDARSSRPLPSWTKMYACQPPLQTIFFWDDTNRGNYIDAGRPGGALIADTICNEPGFEHTFPELGSMVPVVFAKDVVRTHYRKGELKFEKCELDLGYITQADGWFHAVSHP